MPSLPCQLPIKIGEYPGGKGHTMKFAHCYCAATELPFSLPMNLPVAGGNFGPGGTTEISRWQAPHAGTATGYARANYFRPGGAAERPVASPVQGFTA
jgi:hypothetical protein